MKYTTPLALLASWLATTALASPTPASPDIIAVIPEPIDKRAAIPPTITTEPQVDAALAGASDHDTFDLILNRIQPSAKPSSVAEAVQRINDVHARHPTNIRTAAFNLVLQGVASREKAKEWIAQHLKLALTFNNNPSPPAGSAVYPRKGASDAPYTLPESVLRNALYIPPTFTYGRIKPVLLVPGTGNIALETYSFNFGKLFAGSDYADPVYLNVPGHLLNDVQLNTEFVAYAINYLSAISGNARIGVVAWSQGSIISQWAFRYWPSTRGSVDDLIVISGDLKGTVLADALCLALPCQPAVEQQRATSRLVATLRNGGGASAYVPTTVIYSATDEIVQPQSGAGASSYVLDSRGVGVTNAFLQEVCHGLPAGGLYTHEGVLYNPIAFALARDALTHDGPGLLSRIDLGAECRKVVPDGLGVEDVLGTEAALVVAAVGLVTYPVRTFVEPPIRGYAVRDVPR
jgi:hypothetical protein